MAEPQPSKLAMPVRSRSPARTVSTGVPPGSDRGARPLRPGRVDDRGVLSRRALLGAAALVVMGVLCLLIELQSPSVVLLTGDRVQGYSEGGIAY